MPWSSSLRRLSLAIATAVMSAGCAHSPSYDPQDPLEKANRAVFTFNAAADTYVIRPIADGYTRVVPDFARTGIRNFLSNLFYPTVIINDVLQWKWTQAGLDTARFLTNTTAGLGGLLDVATEAGLPAHDEDFGQTLGYWGLGQGWFIMIPLLGPSSNRDFVGLGVNAYTNPTVLMDAGPRLAVTGMVTVDTRAALLGTDRLVNQQFDPYTFLRSAYLDRRHNLVHDGSPPPEEMDFDLDFDE